MFTESHQLLWEAYQGLNGKAKKEHVTETDVNPEQLAMGIKVEAEHTDDPVVAKTIALDHLAEDPEYYTKLQKAGL